MKRILLTFLVVALAMISAACSSATAKPQPSGTVAHGPTVVAKDIKFAPATVEVKAGQAFTLHLDNQEAAPHNIAIFTDSSASTPVSTGDVVSSGKAEQVVPALTAGTYFFRCDVHREMTGTIVAK